MTKPFSYKGKIITASSKEEAIHKILAESKVDMSVVNKWAKKNMDITDNYLGKDHWEFNGKIYYTWDAAVRLAKKVPGYHLPTAEEWNELANACGGVCKNPDAKEGEQNFENLQEMSKLLHFKKEGLYRRDKGLQAVGNSDYFWTSTNYTLSLAFFKDINSAKMRSDWANKFQGFSVRLIKD